MNVPDTASQFNDPAVRDLAWLLFSPGLLNALHAGAPLARPVAEDERERTLQWLAALDRKPVALHAHVHKPSLKRLGLYAEALLEYFLQHGPGARLIAANVPLRASGTTLGEVDFLLQSARRERLHWELAVKFYLHIGEGRAALSDYVGPNLQDRFDLKHDRLLNHQLGLSARDEFASLGFEGPWRAELFVKGRLFYRRESMPALPSELAEDHLRGWWMTVSEWRESKGDGAFAVVPRLSWLSERSLFKQDAEALKLHAGTLAKLTSPIMVAKYDIGAGDVWPEHSRGFVVPDEWPERALHYARLTTT